MKNPAARFDGMKLFISDQERVDLSVEPPYDLMSHEEFETVNWVLSQLPDDLGFVNDESGFRLTKNRGEGAIAKEQNLHQSCSTMYMALMNFLRFVIRIEGNA